jgi:hypothetical protein
MKAYLAVRAEGEALIRVSGMNATLIRVSRELGLLLDPPRLGDYTARV